MVLWRLTGPFRTNTQKYVLFIIGDWNAKVGSQETPGVTCKFGLGIRNEAGQRLIEFCQENAVVIVNTLFQQHRSRLYTWKSPDGQHWNQVDYILCSQRWRSSIQSTKTRPGADFGSDHELLIAKFRLKLMKVGKTTRPFWKLGVHYFTVKKWVWVKEDRRGNEKHTENKGGELQTVNKVRNCALYFHICFILISTAILWFKNYSCFTDDENKYKIT